MLFACCLSPYPSPSLHYMFDASRHVPPNHYNIWLMPLTMFLTITTISGRCLSQRSSPSSQYLVDASHHVPHHHYNIWLMPITMFLTITTISGWCLCSLSPCSSPSLKYLVDASHQVPYEPRSSPSPQYLVDAFRHIFHHHYNIWLMPLTMFLTITDTYRQVRRYGLTMVNTGALI